MDKKQNNKEEKEINVQMQDESKQEEVVDEEFEALKDLASQLENNYKRALADYQNLQRRVQEEKSEWIKIANKQLLLKMLTILDTLYLAEKHTEDKNFTLTIQQFLQILQEEGVEKIKTIGEKFDPFTMEAVETREGKDGEVLEEASAGYTLYGQVLRPAKVIVGK